MKLLLASFLRGTMGLISSGDEYYRRIATAVSGLQRLANVRDDFLLNSDDLQHT